MGELRKLDQVVDPCPHCGKAHTISLNVLVDTPAGSRPLGTVSFFGAGSSNRQDAPPAENQWSVGAICPDTGRAFITKISVQVGPGERVAGVEQVRDPASGSGAPLAPTSAAPPPAPVIDLAETLLTTELTEVIKQSNATVRDYSKAMLTAALAAIPALFAVTKYLGAEKASGTIDAWVGAVAALLFLFAAGGFAAAMRPWYGNYSSLEEYAAARRDRLWRINLVLLVATALFALGVMAAIGLFAYLLARR